MYPYQARPNPNSFTGVIRDIFKDFGALIIGNKVFFLDF